MGRGWPNVLSYSGSGSAVGQGVAQSFISAGVAIAAIDTAVPAAGKNRGVSSTAKPTAGINKASKASWIIENASKHFVNVNRNA